MPQGRSSPLARRDRIALDGRLGRGAAGRALGRRPRPPAARQGAGLGHGALAGRGGARRRRRSAVRWWSRWATSAARSARPAQSGIDVSASLETVGGPVQASFELGGTLDHAVLQGRAESTALRCPTGGAAGRRGRPGARHRHRRRAAVRATRARGARDRRRALRLGVGGAGRRAHRRSDLDARLRPAVAGRGRRRLHRHRAGSPRPSAAPPRCPTCRGSSPRRRSPTASRRSARSRARGGCSAPSSRSIGCSLDQGPGTAEASGRYDYESGGYTAAVRGTGLRLGRPFVPETLGTLAVDAQFDGRGTLDVPGGPASCASFRRAAASPNWSAPRRPACSWPAAGSQTRMFMREARALHRCQRGAARALRRSRHDGRQPARRRAAGAGRRGRRGHGVGHGGFQRGVPGSAERHQQPDRVRQPAGRGGVGRRRPGAARAARRGSRPGPTTSPSTTWRAGRAGHAHRARPVPRSGRRRRCRPSSPAR